MCENIGSATRTAERQTHGKGSALGKSSWLFATQCGGRRDANIDYKINIVWKTNRTTRITSTTKTKNNNKAALGVFYFLDR